MKIDMHCHSYYSKDSFCSPEILIDQAKKNGLDGIAITDHNTSKAWRRMAEYAKKKDILLILGEEIKIKEDGKTLGEILAYFIYKEIDPTGKNPREIIKEIHDQGGIAIISHPFHRTKPFETWAEYKDDIDGIEIFNSRSQTKEGNSKSLKIAEENGLPFTAGSDAHTPWEVGNTYIESNAQNLDELKNSILNREISFIGKQTPYLIQVLAPISKMMHSLKLFQ